MVRPPQGAGDPDKRDEKPMTSLEERPMSAGDSGYQRIRSDIIFGVLTPSGRLRLDAMKEGVSRSLEDLAEIGFVFDHEDACHAGHW